MRTKKSTGSAVVIGPTPEGVEATRSAIMEILNCGNAGDQAKIAAFDALKSMCSVSNVSITNCNFDIGQK